MPKAKPAKQGKSNSQDVQAVGIIMSILGEHERVVPDIKAIDKYPNIDGHIQVKDADDYPIGNIAISVKPVDVKKNGLVFDCPVSILAYAAIDPTILLGVDKRTNKIYWFYLDSYVLADISYEDNSSTKRIEFAADHVISKRRKEYIDHWTAIIEKNHQRLTGYDAKEKELSDILKNTNRITGTSDEKFINLHVFIDEMNRLLDNDFPAVKRFFYPMAWKVGVAYGIYDENQLTYSLYPIHISHNDVQIKEINDELAKTIKNQGLSFRMMAKNPIMARPKQHAKELVGEDIMRLVNNKLLRHAGNTALARELIFAFVDKFNVQLGIMPEVADRQNVRTLNFGFDTYLPAWIDEAYKLLIEEKRNNIEARLVRNGYYDPDVLGEIMPDELSDIQQKTGKRLGKKSGTYRIASRGFNVRAFAEALNYVTSLNPSGNIDRLYRKADWSRLGKIGSYKVWDKFSKEDAEANLRIVFENLPEAYSQIVQSNFPTLVSELDLFGEANVIYIYADISEDYETSVVGPTYHAYWISETGRNEKAIEFIDKASNQKYEEYFWSVQNREAAEYKILYGNNSVLDFLYSDTPLMDLIYEILTTRLKDYFRK